MRIDEDDPTLREEVLRRYFPDRQGFEAFGPPHKDRRERQARDAAEKLRRTQREEENRVLKEKASEAAAASEALLAATRRAEDEAHDEL